MKSNKIKIVSLVIAAILAQGTCATFAATSKDSDYTKDELNNLEPGFEWKDVNKSNYKVNSYKNSFSSTQTPETGNDSGNDKSDSTSTATNTTVESNLGNVIVSSTPSTGRKGDFWGKTKDGKWILIEQGTPASGWRNVRGQWYYMDADGVMQTGWINDGETWYYLNSNGSMAYNTYVDGYYLDWNGAMH
ncbi:cell wall-binding protein [Clostridium chromiireducens]|uniref:Autolysin n=1 Tax=Clostridium chromiireducens TaxID=225345 RepID=A0A1V4IQJ4_9CLOT|nr:cell wall-binding protein [Clostridium chromiireducens]MVX66007.1 cell wall-binding protein [Clostridium chromiireducens]OPJ62186.1 autolysin [Clostridium chromiireducens]RII35617.1 cell wall-binding protein [Clostridium chromiireducens]